MGDGGGGMLRRDRRDPLDTVGDGVGGLAGINCGDDSTEGDRWEDDSEDITRGLLDGVDDMDVDEAEGEYLYEYRGSLYFGFCGFFS